MNWTDLARYAVDAVCSTLTKIKQFEYSNPFSNGAMDAAENIVLNAPVHCDRAVVEAAGDYLIHAFNQAKKQDLARDSTPPLPGLLNLPDYRS